ncbi:MAG TPA: hypothetical protein VGQ82_04970, partial [Chthoniobacterales bacterium]|nr:hypothetical protein [Chthoniobacterales bacterium]
VGLLADAYSTVGRDREAWPYALRYRARSEDSVWAMGLLGVIAARSNRRAVALAYSDSLASRHSDGKGQAMLSRARIAAALHDTAAAMHLIRQASAERSQVMWQHDSDFEELRGYSDYENLRNPEGAPRKRGTLASLLARSR